MRIEFSLYLFVPYISYRCISSFVLYLFVPYIPGVNKSLWLKHYFINLYLVNFWNVQKSFALFYDTLFSSFLSFFPPPPPPPFFFAPPVFLPLFGWPFGPVFGFGLVVFAFGFFGFVGSYFKSEGTKILNAPSKCRGKYYKPPTDLAWHATFHMIWDTDHRSVSLELVTDPRYSSPLLAWPMSVGQHPLQHGTSKTGWWFIQCKCHVRTLEP